MTISREEAKLLPCPFCGGEAERYDDHNTGSFNEGMSCIQCKRCGASSAMHGDRRENLYASWNERRSQAGNARSVAALTEMPSSLNDACRKLELAYDEINRLKAQSPPKGEAVRQRLEECVEHVRHYLHRQIGKPVSQSLISAPEIALNGLLDEVRAAFPREESGAA